MSYQEKSCLLRKGSLIIIYSSFLTGETHSIHTYYKTGSNFGYKGILVHVYLGYLGKE